jgi:tRNA pseudouridine55 synthase
MNARAGLAGSPGELCGVLVIDKEAGFTSHDVVARVRRALGERRVGHSGTLDPDATGVLVVGVGRATRLLRFVAALPKRYVGELVLGTATSTLDASGEVVATASMEGVDAETVRRAAESLVGSIEQVPPMYSARKVGGRRLYELARRGVEVERPPRRVQIERFDIEPTADPLVYRFDVACSSGTYVRTLVADLGERLGGVAHVRRLRRVAIGSLEERDARPLDEVTSAHLLPPAVALKDLEALVVPPELERAVLHGLPLDRVALKAEGNGPYALVDSNGALVAVYEATGTDRLRAAVVLGRARPRGVR